MTKAQAAWLDCVEVVDDEKAYEAAYAKFVAAVAEEEGPVDPISGRSAPRPPEAPRRGKGRPSHRELDGLEALDIDPEEKPVPVWVGVLDIFAVAAGSKVPRDIPRRVRREVLDIAARLRRVRACKIRAF